VNCASRRGFRDTFGKYVDPRIVAGLLDHPELTDEKASRR